LDYRHKFIVAETKVMDDEGRVEAVVSTETKDRDGDIIRADGWDLTNFQANPVMLSSHNYASLRSVIGEWENMRVEGKQLVGTAKYYIGKGNEEADWAHQLASMGKAAFSVGFRPDMDKASPLDAKNPFGGLEFEGQELLEVSHVSIPSNPDALQVMRSIQLHPDLDEFIKSLAGESTTVTNAEGVTWTAWIKNPSEEKFITLDDLAKILPGLVSKQLSELLPDMVKGLIPNPEPTPSVSMDDLRAALKRGQTRELQE